MINTDIDWELVCKQYHEQGVSVIDNFITDLSTINFLRDYALKSSYRDSFYSGYSALDFDSSQALPYKLRMLADDAQKTLPVLNNKQFSRGWFFIYDSESNGVNIHVDPYSEITLNIWVTPDEGVSSGKGFNGIDVWRIEPKPEWGYDISNHEYDMCLDYVHQEQADMISVEYRFKRAVMFNSNYFHRSQPVRCREGQDNRKINYALLFNGSE